MNRILTVAAALALAAAINFNVYLVSSAGPKNSEHKAEAQLLMASVDMSILLSFHPLVRYFTPDLSGIIIPFENYRLSDLPVLAAERTAKHKATREALKIDIEKIRTEINAVRDDEIAYLRDAQKKQMELTKAYEEDIKKIRSETERKNRIGRHLRDFSNIDLDYYSYKKKLEERSKKSTEQLGAAAEKIMAVNFLGKEETEKLLSRIVSEINSAVREAAAEHGVSVVLNSSFSNGLASNEKTAGETSGAGDAQPAADATSEVSAAKPFTYDDPAGMYASRLAASRIFERAGALSSPIVTGGPDLTAPALEKLLKKYSIPKENAAMLIDAIGALRNTAGKPSEK